MTKNEVRYSHELTQKNGNGKGLLIYKFVNKEATNSKILQVLELTWMLWSCDIEKLCRGNNITIGGH